MYNCGRKLLLPLLFMINKSKYGPLSVKDIGTFAFRCTPEVRLLRRKLFTLMGQGFGQKLEETNKLIKQFISGICRGIFAVFARDYALNFQIKQI